MLSLVGCKKSGSSKLVKVEIFLKHLPVIARGALVCIKLQIIYYYLGWLADGLTLQFQFN